MSETQIIPRQKVYNTGKTFKLNQKYTIDITTDMRKFSNDFCRMPTRIAKSTVSLIRPPSKTEELQVPILKYFLFVCDVHHFEHSMLKAENVQRIKY